MDDAEKEKKKAVETQKKEKKIRKPAANFEKPRIEAKKQGNLAFPKEFSTSLDMENPHEKTISAFDSTINKKRTAKKMGALANTDVIFFFNFLS